MEAGKRAAGEVLALQKRVLAVLNEARYAVTSVEISAFFVKETVKLIVLFKILIACTYHLENYRRPSKTALLTYILHIESL